MTQTAPAAVPPRSRSRSRLMLVLVVGVFLVPMLAAAILNWMNWMPSHSRNFGEVVHPPISLREVDWVQPGGTRIRLANANEAWTLLVRVPASCDDACWKQVGALANVRVSLGPNEDKLQLMLVDGKPPAAMPAPLSAQLSAFALASPAASLPARLAAPLAQGPELWLVNPNGLVEMRYAPGFVTGELRKDLVKVIR